MINLTFHQEAIPGSNAWKNQMLSLGTALADKNVRHILLSHGTFAGNDPLGINSLIGNIEIANDIQLFSSEAMKNFTKHAVDFLAKDLGNFTRDYINAFGSAIQNNINCEAFDWSGGNHHMARLIGAVELCNKLANISNDYGDDDRILLVGHSHAGQVFALLTTLLENTDKSVELIDIINQAPGLDTSGLNDKLNAIKKIKLDIVTFGAPIRYRWGNYGNYRLMSIINDRGNHVDIKGVINTRDGDYVQQWGTEGTDILQPSFSQLNKELDSILLNKGQFPAAELRSKFIAKLNDKQRKEPLDYNGNAITETFLIDYQDQDDDFLFDNILEFDGIPHCINTLFGHGVYTRKKAMLFNTEHIVNNFY